MGFPSDRSAFVLGTIKHMLRQHDAVSLDDLVETVVASGDGPGGSDGKLLYLLVLAGVGVVSLLGRAELVSRDGRLVASRRLPDGSPYDYRYIALFWGEEFMGYVAIPFPG